MGLRLLGSVQSIQEFTEILINATGVIWLLKAAEYIPSCIVSTGLGDCFICPQIT